MNFGCTVCKIKPHNVILLVYHETCCASVTEATLQLIEIRFTLLQTYQVWNEFPFVICYFIKINRIHLQ